MDDSAQEERRKVKESRCNILNWKCHGEGFRCSETQVCSSTYSGHGGGVAGVVDFHYLAMHYMKLVHSNRWKSHCSITC